MRVHGTCIAHDGLGVLIRGASRSGKSDLALRLISQGFVLVADDQVDIEQGIATCPPPLKGIIEVRGMGLYAVPFQDYAAVRLVVRDGRGERIASPIRCEWTDAPLVELPLLHASSADVVRLALDCLNGKIREVAGPLGGLGLTSTSLVCGQPPKPSRPR